MTARRAALLGGLTALLIAGAAGVPGRSAVDPSIRLRYGLRPGAAYDQTTTLALAMQIKSEGLPEAAATLIQAIVKDSKQDLRLQGRVETGAKGGDGSLPLTYRLVDAKGTLTMGGQTKDLLGDPQRLAGATLGGRLLPDGRTIDLSGGPGDAAHPMPSGVKDRIIQSLPALPDRDIRIGERFEVPGGISLAGLPGGAQGQIEAKCAFTLKSLDDGVAVFDVLQTMSVPSGTSLPGNRTLAVSGGGTGTATYDRREGIFTSLKMEMDVLVTMGMSGAAVGGDPRLQQLPPGTVAEAVSIKAAVRGPMAVTMARAPAAP